MRRLLESSATALVIAGLTGDIASTTSLAAAAPTLLVQTKYSRANEREADAYAVELLQKAQVNPRYLATMLARLETRSRRYRPGLPDFLSTHPAPEERKALALAASRQAGEFEEPEQESVAIPDSRQLRVLDPVQRELITLVEKRDYAALERLLAAKQQRYEQDPATEQELEMAFRAFRYLGASAEGALKEWAQGMPRSYAAHTARGVYYLWRGVEARGTAYSSQTSEEQMHAMNVLLDRAASDFERSLGLTAKPYISHLSFVTLSRYLGERELGDRHYQDALAIAPMRSSVPRTMARPSASTRKRCASTRRPPTCAASARGCFRSSGGTAKPTPRRSAASPRRATIRTACSASSPPQRTCIITKRPSPSRRSLSKSIRARGSRSRTAAGPRSSSDGAMRRSRITSRARSSAKPGRSRRWASRTSRARS